MASKAAIETEIAVVPAPDLGADTFINEHPFTSPATARSVFGGFILGQAVKAASATVPTGFDIYASQSSFVNPVNARERVVYHVERISDGRSFATRLVRATQGSGDGCVHVAVLSFQDSSATAGNALTYSSRMPELNGVRPEDVAHTGIWADMREQGGAPIPGILTSSDNEPVDWRPVDFTRVEDPLDFRILAFVRAPPLSTDSRAVHLSSLACLSDELLMGCAAFANSAILGNRLQNMGMGASLSHNLSFHDPEVRVDQWMVCERHTSWGASGRVLLHQRFWSYGDGRLLMSCTQEALIRLRDAKM
ncbi:Thioesterase/thiol ester dehydrase-isomerase [Xylariomycetidae sp. FL2044]|nr:Thioesterase/thiol ester dehydrase-isomerase [Xylariomycetidae sp. FL2044]